MTDEKPKADRTSTLPYGAGKKLCWFGGASVLWIIISGAIGLYLGVPDGANTWGDFLAGVSAPAAFAMLFAAVWIQSDELREQRKELGLTREELKLTRKEFVENRKVMKEQAEQATKQAEFIAAQTDILLRDRTDEEFKVRLRLLRTFVTSTFDAKYGYVKNSGNRAIEDTGLMTGAMPTDPEKFFIKLCKRLSGALPVKPDETSEPKTRELAQMPLDALVMLNGKLRRLLEMEERLSGSMAAVLQSVNLPYVVEQLNSFNEKRWKEEPDYQAGPRDAHIDG
ncbi:MAG TPA: hypothetical protein VGN93_18440 [Shinella sp.]|jgi:hypothetical protein|uniref:hypothetical protein n=1 Tax=Shinella sp. TaxID=1870904 RepID=UPI002E0E8E08|nr:hypothetical protein [Shinella sp.]